MANLSLFKYACGSSWKIFNTLFISLLLFTFQLWSQPQRNPAPDIKAQMDSLRLQAISLIRKQQFDRAMPLLTEAISVSRRYSLDSCLAADLYLMSVVHRFKRKYDSTFYYLTKSREIALARNYLPLLALTQIDAYGVYNAMGKGDSAAAMIERLRAIEPLLDSNSAERAKIEMYLGHNAKHDTRYSEALEHYYRALKGFVYQKDSTNQGNIYISLANVLVILGQQQKALSYHQQAAYLFTLMGRRFQLVNELLNITDMYYTSDRLDSAEHSITSALPIAESLNDTSYLAYIYLDLGNIYKRRRKFPDAEAYLLKSVSLGEVADNQNSLGESYQGLGEMYMSQKQPAKAGPWLEKHLMLAKKQNNKEEVIEAIGNLAENEYALQHYARAYEYQKQYAAYKDSAYTDATAKRMAEMESKYQVEKKESEIVLLKKNQLIDHISLQKQRNIQVAILVFALLLLLIAFLLVNRYRVIQRSRRLIELEKMRNSIAADLHDDIGSGLSSINILSKMSLQQQTSVDPFLINNMKKIKEHSSAIMESVGDIVWTINPRNDSIEQMIVRMKEFAGEILEPLNIQYKFEDTLDASSMHLDLKKRKDFYLLFKEAVNNAAKYSQCSNLIFGFRQTGHLFRFSIQDDGVGFNEHEVKNGNGLHNMKERARNMGANFDIRSAPGQGTSITVEWRIT